MKIFNLNSNKDKKKNINKNYFFNIMYISIIILSFYFIIKKFFYNKSNENVQPQQSKKSDELKQKKLEQKFEKEDTDLKLKIMTDKEIDIKQKLETEENELNKLKLLQEIKNLNINDSEIKEIKDKIKKGKKITDKIKQEENDLKIKKKIQIYSTTTFEIRKSKKFQTIYGLYIQDYILKNKSQIKIYNYLYDRASKAIDDNGIDYLYDSRRSRYMYRYLFDKLTKLNQKILWTSDVELIDSKSVQFEIKVEPLFDDLKKINFRKFIENVITKDTSKNWYIIPLGVPQHQLGIFIYKRKYEEYELFILDPNGEINTSIEKVDEKEKTLKYYTYKINQFFESICKMSDLLNYNGNLLRKLSSQGDNVLLYLNTEGFCAAFVWLIIFYLIINPDITPEQLYNYIEYRVYQWRKNHEVKTYAKEYIDIIKKISNLDIVKDVKINFNVFRRVSGDENTVYLYSEYKIYQQRNMTDKEMKQKYQRKDNLYPINEFVDYFFIKDNEDDYNNLQHDFLIDEYYIFLREIVKSLNPLDKKSFRKQTFKFSKDLSYFENQILMFLMFIKELEEKFLLY